MSKPGATDRTPEEAVFARESGQRIRMAREGRSLTQVQLAQVLGIDQCTLSHYERGTNDMPFSRLHRLAQALEVSPAYLVGGEKENEWVEAVEQGMGQLKISHIKALFRSVLQALVREAGHDLTDMPPLDVSVLTDTESGLSQRAA